MILLNCHTKPKIDLSKLGNKYEICGNWTTFGGFTNTYRGVTSAFKIDRILTIYEDETFIYKCDRNESYGGFEVVGDTVIFIGFNQVKSRYLYNLSGHDLTFTKLDSNIIPICIYPGNNDPFSGTWKYK